MEELKLHVFFFFKMMKTLLMDKNQNKVIERIRQKESTGDTQKFE